VAFCGCLSRGPIQVRTIVGKFNVVNDPAQPIVILAGHYDTLFKNGFVGANDDGSSTAILLGRLDALEVSARLSLASQRNPRYQMPPGQTLARAQGRL